MNLKPINPLGIPQNGIIGKSLPTPMKPTHSKKEKSDDHTQIISHTADVSGCAHYRHFWPHQFLNSSKNYIINESKKPCPIGDWYGGTDVIRMQRQVSSTHFEIYKFLRKVSDKHNIRLVYEIDDIPLYEDIPLYNKNRSSFANDTYRTNIIEMMKMSDEVTVTCKFMRDYFEEKTGKKNVTVIPNYMPRSWCDRFYDENKLKINFSKNKKKPRILYAGSGSHYSINGTVEDDFTKLEEFVIKTLKDYQWVFFGGLPRKLIPLYKSGKIEFHNYSPVVNYPYTFDKLNATISIAPLVKNNFNRAKSNIKLIESGAWGIPCICQDDIETYADDAIYKFDTPDELHDQIKRLTTDAGVYMKACRKSKMIADRFWLDDNIDVWDEFYKNPFLSDKREKLNKLQ